MTVNLFEAILSHNSNLKCKKKNNAYSWFCFETCEKEDYFI